MPYIIAEMACAHNGDHAQAMELTRISAEAGADAVQLQFVPEHTVTPTHEVFDVLQQISFDKEGWRKVFDYGSPWAWTCGYVPTTCPVSSGLQSLELTASNSTPQICPTPMCCVRWARPRFHSPWVQVLQPLPKSSVASTLHGAGARNAVLMHGVQNFPTKRENLNVSRVQLLQRLFPAFPWVMLTTLRR